MIYVCGSLAFDYIMDFPGSISEQIIPDKIHNINLSFLVDKLTVQRGGTAGNIAYNLSLLKTKSAVIGAVGKDFSEYFKFLKSGGVETKYINTLHDDLTARAYIITDSKDNQITGFYPGALKFASQVKLPKTITASDFIIIAPTNLIDMKDYTNYAVTRKIPFMFDPGMQLPRISEDVLKTGIKNAKVVIGNDYEIALLMKKLKLDKINLGADQVLITTLGEKGCVIATKNSNLKINAAKPKQVLDPTGAGDAFRAGFVSGLTGGLSLEVCGRMGCLSAVYAVEKYGTTNHKYTVKDFKKRYKQNYNEELRY